MVHQQQLVIVPVRGLALLCVLTAAACSAADDRDAAPPNIVLFLADDVGQECLSCYGGESYDTPHLDHLASTGMRFRHCYSMPVCFPTRLTLLTGRYPFRFGDVRWGDFPRSAERQTIAHLLADAGYATGVFGKWQLALLKNRPDHADTLGFDESYLFGWHEGPRYYQPLIYHNGQISRQTDGHYGPDLYVRQLIEFIKQNRDRPFFAWYSMAVCHDVTNDLDHPVPHGPLGRYDSYSEMVAEMDRAVGRVMGALDALKLRQRTIVIFVADNGTPARMILRAEGDELIRVPVVSRRNDQDVAGGKGTLTDRGTRVPLLVSWPGTIDSDQVVEDLVDVSDFFPTLAAIAGVPLPASPPLDGLSLQDLLTSDGPGPRQTAYAELRQSRWVRTHDWKLYSDGRLFNMQQDPDETSAISLNADKQNTRAIRRQLMSQLSRLTDASAAEQTD